MLTMKPGSVLRTAAIAAALSTLAACGGGSSAVSATDPLPPTPPGDPTPPADPTTPADPAAPPELKLAAAYTSLPSAERLSQSYWPAWTRTGTAVIDGVGCATSEAYHIHSMLSIYQNGVRLQVPAEIGITSCHYDLHTHDGSGVIHIETPVPKTFTLGQFFSLWGQPLSATGVAGLPGTPAFYVIQNETVTRVTADPAGIALEPHKEIVIVTGTPPAEVVRWNWAASGL